MDNVLVVYYSLFGTTKELALEIQKQTNGSIRELVPEDNYSFNYNTASKEVRNQINRGYCPRLTLGNEPIDDYEIIFIGSPNWFKTLAPPVMSFIQQNDFTGKIIIPFCTHGGGGFGKIENDIASKCPKSEILPGLALNGSIESEKVINWIQEIDKS